MEFLQNLGLGFATALSPMNLFLAFTGCLVGTLVGVLPGVGPIATIAMLMPLTLKVDPTGALIMLAGIYYGAQYGGSTTAILVNIPGESSAVVTCLDGYQMARNGRAGPALGIAALGSFFAGTVATFVIAIALITEPRASTTARMRPVVISAKYSAGPNSSASLVSGAPMAAMISVATVPAKNDPSAAMPSAIPASPFFAIS